MLYLLLSILLSVGLLINFRLFPRFNIPTVPVIILNYFVCFLLGYSLMGKEESFQLDLNVSWTWYCLALGMGFIITFMLSGAATQRIGMTLTSLANNISLIIPVLFSLFVFESEGLAFGPINYTGLVIGIIAVGIATYKADGSDHKAGFWQSGGLALAVFICYGISNTAINYIQMNLIKNSPGAIPVMLIMVLGAILCGILLGIYRGIKGLDQWNWKVLLASITLGVPNFLSFYFLIMALNYYGSSGAFVYPLYNMGVILVSAFISVLLFKEKLNNMNKVGLALAVLAIVLISWNSLFV